MSPPTSTQTYLDFGNFDSKQSESKIEPRHYESRHNDSRGTSSLRPDGTRRTNLRTKSSLKQPKMESIGGIGPEGGHDAKLHRHSAYVEGRHASDKMSSYHDVYSVNRNSGLDYRNGLLRSEDYRSSSEYRSREYRSSDLKNSSTLQHSSSHLNHTNKYSSHTLQFHREMLNRPGSPVWKPRSIVRNSTGAEEEYSATTTSATPATKQRVAFAIPDAVKDEDQDR